MIALWIKIFYLCFNFPSRTEHVKFCLNLGGPPSKAKYVSSSDSVLVPWGKGEKNPCEGSEIESETVCQQAVGGLCLSLLRNAWRRTFCIMGQGLIFNSKIKPLGVVVAKASLNRALVIGDRPEAGRSSHGQGEASGNWCGGPNHWRVKTSWMTCG